MRYIRNSGRKPGNKQIDILRNVTCPHKFTVNQFLKAINGSGGVKSDIAKRLKCARPTVNRYLKENEELYDAWESELESALDLGESSLLALVKAKDFNAIKFFLTTKGKERGYGDSRQFEVNQNVSGTVEHQHKLEIELKPDTNRTDSVLNILNVCGAFNPETKRLTKDDVEIISA